MAYDNQASAANPTGPGGQQAGDPTLRIEGLVSVARSLTPADLAALPRSGVAANFRCDGKSTPQERFWRGPRLLDVVATAGPLPAAGYIRVGAGKYVAPLSRQEAEEAILADTVNDQPLSVENGGPWRLVLPGVRHFANVKWVDRLELAAEPGENTGLESVRVRNRARRAKRQAQATP